MFKVLVLIPYVLQILNNGDVFSWGNYRYGPIPWDDLLTLLVFVSYIYVAYRLLAGPPKALVISNEDGTDCFVRAITRQIGLFAFLLASGTLVSVASTWTQNIYLMIRGGNQPPLVRFLLAVPLPVLLIFVLFLVFGPPRRLTDAICRGSRDDSLGARTVLHVLFFFGAMLFLVVAVSRLHTYASLFGPPMTSVHSTIVAEFLSLFLGIAASIYLICGAPALVRWASRSGDRPIKGDSSPTDD